MTVLPASYSLPEVTWRPVTNTINRRNGLFVVCCVLECCRAQRHGSHAPDRGLKKERVSAYWRISLAALAEFVRRNHRVTRRKALCRLSCQGVL